MNVFGSPKSRFGDSRAAAVAVSSPPYSSQPSRYTKTRQSLLAWIRTPPHQSLISHCWGAWVGFWVMTQLMLKDQKMLGWNLRYVPPSNFRTVCYYWWLLLPVPPRSPNWINHLHHPKCPIWCLQLNAITITQREPHTNNHDRIQHCSCLHDNFPPTSAHNRALRSWGNWVNMQITLVRFRLCWRWQRNLGRLCPSQASQRRTLWRGRWSYDLHRSSFFCLFIFCFNQNFLWFPFPPYILYILHCFLWTPSPCPYS